MRFVKIFILSIILMFSFMACETVKKRIEKNLEYFLTLPKDIQEKISAGKIDLGFNPRMVYLAWGKARDESELTDLSGSYKSWLYTRTDTETHWRDVRYYDEEEKKWKTKRESYYLEYEYATKFVVFKDGVVVRFGTYPGKTLYSGPVGKYDPYSHPYRSYSGCAQKSFGDALLCSYMHGHL